MSDSVQPHRRQPIRLPRPWDSPGKNTGVGCHFLLQCMKVKSESEVTHLCPTLSDPMDCSLPGSSVRGILQARVLGWGVTAFSCLRLTTLFQMCFSHSAFVFYKLLTVVYQVCYEISLGSVFVYIYIHYFFSVMGVSIF